MKSKKQTIAVGSENPVKIDAVKRAFEKVWPRLSWEITGVAVRSGVPDQPMSDEESITGARNRATRAMKKTNADWGVGLEGGIQKIGDTWYDCGWMVVVDASGREGIGSTIRMEVPAAIMRLIHEGQELGHANDEIFGTTNSKQAEGHFGLMTNNAITRTSGYMDGIIAALSRFIQADVFEKSS